MNPQNHHQPSAAPSATASGARYSLFAAPPAGTASLVAALAGRLSHAAIHLNAHVELVAHRADHCWQLELDIQHPATQRVPGIQHPASDSTSRNSQSLFDALILAVPAHAAAQMLRSTDAELAASLAEIEYASCAVVSVACRRSQIGHSLESFGFVVPRIENRRIIAASFASQKFPDRAPTNSVLIRAFVGGALQPELALLPDDELEKLVRDELADLIQLTGNPLWTDIARWPRSMPQYHLGHLDRARRIEQLAARHTGLAFAGNAYQGVGIPKCIHSGERAADRIAEFLSSAGLT